MPLDDPDPRARSASSAGGGIIAALPLTVLLVPLLWHRSEHPAFGPYSRPYLVLLLGAATAAGVVALLVGRACRRARGRAPAYAFVLCVAAVASTLLAAEVALTFRLRREDAFAEYQAWGHKRSLLFAFEATPNHHWSNAGATYSTDGFGFRTHVRGPWHTNARPLIFALGESSVFGYGLNDDETWPHLLEGKLRERLGDDAVTVVNAGNNGYTSVQTLFRFYIKVLPLHPTHVILYAGPNDVYATGPDRLMITENILFNGSVTDYWAAETRGKNPYIGSLLFYVAQRAVPSLAPRTSRPAEARGAPTIYGRKEVDEIGARYVENVRTLCLVARAHGVEPVLATFMHDMPASVPFPPMALRNNNALLRTLAAEQGIALVDLEDALRSAPRKDYFFADRYHPNREGAELIATTIAAAWR